jgi:hypothetical protein
MSVAGGAGRASADPSGTVYGASVGGVGVLSLNSARAGGTSPGSISGLPSGDAVNPVAINAPATLAVTGIVSTFGQFVGVDVIDVPHNKVLGPIQGVSLPPVGFAMDPTNPEIAWSVEDSFGNPQIARVERLDLNTRTATGWVSSLPPDNRGFPVTASSVAIAPNGPNGKTLFVTWGSNNGNNGGEYGVDAVPLGLGANPPVAEWFNPAGVVGSATPTQTNSPNGDFVYLMATDVAVAPDGNHLFVTSVGQSVAGTAQIGSVFSLGLPLQPGEKPFWSVLFGASQTSLSEPMAVKVSPDGTTVYVGGVSYPGLNDAATTSFVVAFDAITHVAKATASIPVTPTFDPSGVSALAVSPDGKTVLAEALDTTSGSVLFPLTASGLTPTGARTVLAGSTPQNDFTNIYGPLDIAITPAQTGPPPTTTTTTVTPPTNTTTTLPSTTTTGPGQTTTTTTTLPGQPAPGTPKLVLNPTVGTPGTIVTVTGTGFQPNTPVTVSWTVSTGSVVIVADSNGHLPPSQLLILTPDVLGPRFAQASSTPQATARFLVVPSTSEPGGDNAGLLFRSESP